MYAHHYLLAPFWHKHTSYDGLQKSKIDQIRNARKSED